MWSSGSAIVCTELHGLHYYLEAKDLLFSGKSGNAFKQKTYCFWTKDLLFSNSRLSDIEFSAVQEAFHPIKEC